MTVDQEFSVGVNYDIENNAQRLTFDGKITRVNEKTRIIVYKCLENKSRYVIIDLQNVSYIDNSGLGLLNGLRNECDGQHQLLIANSSERAFELFEITGLNKVFTLLTTLDKTLVLDEGRM